MSSTYFKSQKERKAIFFTTISIYLELFRLTFACPLFLFFNLIKITWYLNIMGTTC